MKLGNRHYLGFVSIHTLKKFDCEKIQDKIRFREADRHDSDRLRGFDYGHQTEGWTFAILESL